MGSPHLHDQEFSDSLSDSLSMRFEDEYLSDAPNLDEIRKMRDGKKTLSKAFAQSFVCDYMRFLARNEDSITLLQFYYTFRSAINSREQGSFQNLMWRCLCLVRWEGLDPFYDEGDQGMTALMFLDDARVERAIDCLNHPDSHEKVWYDCLL